MEIVWFKRDLRVHDHAPLVAALASGRPVLPLYIVEPALWAQPDASGRHYAFLRDTLADLDRSLRARGARLVIRVGEAVTILHDIHVVHGITALHAHEETGNRWTFDRDIAVRRWARTAAVPVHEKRQHGVWRALDSRNGWATRWDAMMALPRLAAPAELPPVSIAGDPLPTPAALGLADDPCPGRQRGGRREALATLVSFLDSRGRRYRSAMSAPASGAEHCSRLSPHLALGALSLREVWQTSLTARARWREQGDSQFSRAIDSFVSRLHWHCHFIQKLEDAPWLAERCLHPGYGDLPQHDAARLAAWANGATGWPFVDACMRSLVATGWLNFRMRAMVMAVASYHLRLDWRHSGVVLARLFTDYEPGIHWPQVQMQSGTTGTNIPRIYNPVKQGHDQDPDGVFIRRWVPELAALPTPHLHQPWLASPEVRAALAYPAPFLDHEDAARAARAAITAIRHDPAHYAPARAILARHGSRKAGLPDASRRRAVTKTGSGSGQGVLDL